MNFYITSSGELKRKDNSLVFANEKIKKNFPIQNLDAIYAFGEISINSKLLNYLSKLEIPIYFFNYYGFYSGGFFPRDKNVSGEILIKQVDHYKDPLERKEIAEEIVNGSIHNMRKTLMQYGLKDEAEKIKEYIKETSTINQVFGMEANAKKFYYKCFNKILQDENFKFIKRVKQNPDNFINCLISFGNSLLYTTVLSEVFKTQLNPTISYLHEPFEKRYSLNLDLADIFKPLIVDRVIFSLVNQKMLNESHFEKNLDYCYLNEEGRKIFLKEYDRKLKTTIKYPKLNRKVSYSYMIRLECYNLIKKFLEGKKYNSFKIYW